MKTKYLKLMINLLAILCIGLFFLSPKEGQASIYSQVQKSFHGYTLTSSWQIGCATTGDYPSAETENSARSKQLKGIEEWSKQFQKAYDHYISGDHPFTHYRTYLRKDKKFHNEGNYIQFLGKRLHLHFLKDIDVYIKRKIMYDFVLSQAFGDGVLVHLDKEKADKIAGFSIKYIENNPYNLSSYNILHNLDKLLYVAIRKPQIFQKLANQEIDKNPSTYNNNRRQIAFRSKVILTVLQKQPYSNELFESLKTVDAFSEAQLLLLFITDYNHHDFKKTMVFIEANKLPRYTNIKSAYKHLQQTLKK